MRKIVPILSFMVVCSQISGTSQTRAASGTGEMGVSILTNILALDKEEALELCRDNADLRNCDIVVANDELSVIRSVKMSVNDNQNTAWQKDRISGDYPIRMVNFE